MIPQLGIFPTHFTRTQAALEQLKIKAAAIGAPPTEVDALWQEVTDDATQWPWAFDPVHETDRRLMRRWVEHRPRPAEPWQDLATRILASTGCSYTPADVDAHADELAARIAEGNGDKTKTSSAGPPGG